jgi:NAD(P)-dependent dehydrogenase (short-subunit alcohol dehydrogenase family)
MAGVVNMGSRMGSNPVPDWSAYATSKAASAILTQSIAMDIDRAKYPDVLVNELIPGMTKTKMNEHGQDPEEVYPFVRQLVEKPAGSPTGRAFFKGAYTSIWESQPGAAPPPAPPSLLRRMFRKLRG